MSNAGRGAVSGVASGAASGAMVAGPWGAVIGGVVGGISGALTGGAADDAEALAKIQAKFKKTETTENLRRMKLEAEHTLGTARAAVAASNLQMTGTSKKFVTVLEGQMAADRAWLKESSRIQERMIRKGGEAASSGIMTNLFASQIRQLGSAAVSSYGGGMFEGPKDFSSLDQVPQFAPVSLAG